MSIAAPLKLEVMANPTPVGSSTGSHDPRIAEVYACYVQFMALATELKRNDLSHQLVLCRPFSEDGAAEVIAASIAYAASLCLEPTALGVRHGTRIGAFDFVVTSLDEALRALKNEVRKGLSIAVCLQGEQNVIVSEMRDRGVQPDVICYEGEATARWESFISHGAKLANMSFDGLSKHKGAMQFVTWSVSSLPGTWLPKIEKLAARILPEEDAVRKQWLLRSPRYLGRQLRIERCLPLTAEETDLFCRIMREVDRKGKHKVERE